MLSFQISPTFISNSRVTRIWNMMRWWYIMFINPHKFLIEKTDNVALILIVLINFYHVALILMCLKSKSISNGPHGHWDHSRVNREWIIFCPNLRGLDTTIAILIVNFSFSHIPTTLCLVLLLPATHTVQFLSWPLWGPTSQGSPHLHTQLQDGSRFNFS